MRNENARANGDLNPGAQQQALGQRAVLAGHLHGGVAGRLPCALSCELWHASQKIENKKSSQQMQNRDRR